MDEWADETWPGAKRTSSVEETDRIPYDQALPFRVASKLGADKY